MSGIMKVGLRLAGTILVGNTKKNTTKYLQSMCHVRNRCSHINKNPITPAQKESAGYWKIIGAFTKKTLWYSTIPLSIIIGYYTYQVKRNPRFWEDWDMLTAVEDETLKYSIIPSKIIKSSVLFDDGEIRIKTREDDIFLMNDNTRNVIISEELDANIQEPFPKGKPIPIKIGKFNGLLDNGKLTLKTEDGDTTFTFHNTLSLEVKKTSTTLQNEIVAEKKEQPELILEKDGQFNFIYPGSKLTLKTPTREKKWPSMIDPDDSLFLPLYYDTFPITGNFSFSFEDIVKIQADESDEVYYFKHNVNIECDKKLDENLQNKIAIFKELPGDDLAAKELSLSKILTKETKTCDVLIDSGTVVFKTQDGDKFAVRHIVDVDVFDDGAKTYLRWNLQLTPFHYKQISLKN